MYQLMNTYDPSTGKFALANTDAAMNAYLREAEYRNTNWFDEPLLQQHQPQSLYQHEHRYRQGSVLRLFLLYE